MPLTTCPKEYQTSNNGRTTTVNDIWEGPIDELRNHQQAIRYGYTTTAIAPTKGGHARLTASLVTNESGDSGAADGAGGTGAGNGNSSADKNSIEVEWMELRLPVESNPAFDKLTAGEKLLVKDMIDKKQDRAGAPFAGSNGELMATLYDLLAKGTADYSTGVPVVRYTTRGCTGLAAGSAWRRSSPPVAVPGGWEFLKTADRRVKVGSDIQRVEEWTGSKKWDLTLYPKS